MSIRFASFGFLTLTGLRALLCAVVLTTGAQAHSKLVSTQPIDGAELTAPPAQLSLVFNRPLRLVLVTLTDTDGLVLTVDTQDQIADPAERFDLSLPALPSGEWDVSWSALGGDGHAMRGDLHFTIQP